MSAKHVWVFPALLLISLDSSSVSVYREYLSQWHSQFAPWGLRVIQQPPRSASALTTGTHHPLRRLGYFSRRSVTSTGFLELTQAFLHYVFVVAGSFSVSSGPLVRVMRPAARARLSVLQHKLHCGSWGFQYLALEPAQSGVPMFPLFSVGASLLLFGLSLVPQSSIIFCGLTNEFLKRFLRSKAKWQGDEWGKEVVVSGYGWGCFGWGGWKLTHPMSVHVWHQISPLTATSEQMKTCCTPCFPSGLMNRWYLQRLKSQGLFFSVLFSPQPVAPVCLWPLFICFKSPLLSQVHPFCSLKTKILK